MLDEGKRNRRAGRGISERKLSDPATPGNQREYARLAKERSQPSEAAQCAREYIRIAEKIAGHKSILDGNDADLR